MVNSEKKRKENLISRKVLSAAAGVFLLAGSMLFCGCSVNEARGQEMAAGNFIGQSENSFAEESVGKSTENFAKESVNYSMENFAESLTEKPEENFTNEPMQISAETSSEKTTETPVDRHGALHVQGTKLVDKQGETVRLIGMSTHGLAWFPQYANQDTFLTLRDDWKTNCVRLALYTEEYNGYCSGGNKEELKALVQRGVDAATNLGMYVIIDWHVLSDRDPNVHEEEAKAFFAEMSALYKDQENVLYEICNEPNSSASWEQIKSYAMEVIPVIRANDPDAVVIVGTPTWSQDIHLAAESPLAFDNVMYALHFYAATHTDWLRQRLSDCVQRGLPVFVSEFGLCDASGNGRNDFAQAQQWMELLERYDISCCNWNLANKAESSSVISPGCQKISGWTDAELSEGGQWISAYFGRVAKP